MQPLAIYKKRLRGWILTSNNTFRPQFLTLCSSYPLASLKFYRYVEASSPSLGDKIFAWLKYARPTSRVPRQPMWIGGLRKVSLMLRQRQHTVSTSAYSTIIEILQLLQTVVTIGSWNQLPHESPRWSSLRKYIWFETDSQFWFLLMLQPSCEVSCAVAFSASNQKV